MFHFWVRSSSFWGEVVFIFVWGHLHFCVRSSSFLYEVIFIFGWGHLHFLGKVVFFCWANLLNFWLRWGRLHFCVRSSSFYGEVVLIFGWDRFPFLGKIASIFWLRLSSFFGWGLPVLRLPKQRLWPGREPGGIFFKIEHKVSTNNGNIWNKDDNIYM